MAHKPIRLHPDTPNNYNPIYEDDYVDLGIRALEVAATPPIVVNWSGSETVSVEEYCAFMGELVGVEPIFDYTPEAHTPLWPDVTYMHQVLGRTKMPWREGFRRMVAARHPEIALADLDSREGAALMFLPGTPSDEVPAVLENGSGDITTVFVSMATRHPEGTDAEYLQWHSLDHRPEQHRLSAVRASLRLVSTPACRAARAVSTAHFDPIDHVMSYFFSDVDGLEGFLTLSTALGDAGRKLPLLPPVERGVYGVQNKTAAPRVKARCRRAAVVAHPRDVSAAGSTADHSRGTDRCRRRGRGVVSVGTGCRPRLASAKPGQQLTYCFLDQDPVDTAAKLRPALEKRWAATGIEPLLAAPFYPVIPYEWDRYVP